MEKYALVFLFGFFSVCSIFGQQTTIKGSVKDAIAKKPIANVTVAIEDTKQSTQTNALGEFAFNFNVPLGEQVLRI